MTIIPYTIGKGPCDWGSFMQLSAWHLRAAALGWGETTFWLRSEALGSADLVKPSRVRSSTGHRSGHRHPESPTRHDGYRRSRQPRSEVAWWASGHSSRVKLVFTYDIWWYYIIIWLYVCIIIITIIIIFTIIIHTHLTICMYTQLWTCRLYINLYASWWVMICDVGNDAASSSQVWSQQHTSAGFTAGSGVLRELYGVWSWDVCRMGWV